MKRKTDLGNVFTDSQYETGFFFKFNQLIAFSLIRLFLSMTA